MGIYNGGVFRSAIVATVWAICILRSQTSCRCVFVYHGVHAAWSHTEEQSRASEFPEIAIVPVPVRLRNNSHPIPRSLQRASYDSSSERGVIDIGISREEDDVQLVPSPHLHLLFCRWQEIRQSVFHHSAFCCFQLMNRIMSCCRPNDFMLA